MSVVDDSNLVIQAGVLYKKGMGLLYKPWKLRYFRLYADEKILTYETEEGGIIKGRVRLLEAVTEESSFPGKPYAFKVNVKKLNSNGAAIGLLQKE